MGAYQCVTDLEHGLIEALEDLWMNHLQTLGGMSSKANHIKKYLLVTI